jgi:hypothetical protein
MDISSYTSAPETVQLSYEFYNIDINASSCKYVSGLIPLDANDTPIISSNNVTGVQTNPGPSSFIGLHIANYLPPTPNNAFYPAAKNSYRCSDLYIYNYNSANSTQLVHNVKQVQSPLGEVVIKHKPNVSTDPILYICFFLVESNNTSKNSDSNDIDNILNFVTTTQSSASVLSTGLSNCIPAQTMGMQFTDPGGNMVIILSEPIPINSTSIKTLSKFNASILNKLSAASTPSWLVTNPSNAFKLGTSNIIIGGADNIYMECVPTGVSKEEIKAYNLPINSQYTEEASKIEFMGTMVRFTFLVFCVLLLYAGFPSFWGIVNKSILKEYGDVENPDNKLDLDVAEFWYYIYLILIIAVSLTLGFVFKFESMHIAIGFLGMLTLALTSTMILFNRTSKDPQHYVFKQIFSNDNPWSKIGKYFISLAPMTFKNSQNEDVSGWMSMLKFWERPGLWGWLAVLFVVGLNLAFIAIRHNGNLNLTINPDPNNPSSDASVMNILELLDYIFFDIFLLIAIRVFYKINAALQPK